MTLVKTDNESRLLAMCSGFWAVDPSKVNLEDMLRSSRPGSIVRVDGDPNKAIAYFCNDDSIVGCVAGWISELS